MSQTNISAPLLPQASNSNATGSARDREFAQVQEARASLTAAEARLDAYCDSNSADLTSEAYSALVREVNRRSEILKGAQRNYDNALNGGKGTVCLMTDASVLEEIIIKSVKRAIDESETGSSAKRTNSSRKGQKSFVERLVARDGRCPLMNTPSDGSDGAHIISFDFWSRNQVFFLILGNMGRYIQTVLS